MACGGGSDCRHPGAGGVIVAAAGAIGHTGTAPHVTVASAASFSSPVRSMFCESLEGLMALGVGPHPAIGAVL